MKLLFDANVRPALVRILRLEYPDSTPVRDVSLHTGSDAQIWDFARTNGFTVVSKDTDFRNAALSRAFHQRWCGSMLETAASATKGINRSLPVSDYMPQPLVNAGR